jgi:hypothetical protein
MSLVILGQGLVEFGLPIARELASVSKDQKIKTSGTLAKNPDS